MKRYAAFLRGINLNGKNKIAMSDLKKAFLDAGFTDVSTVLNSGNVLFSAGRGDEKELRLRIRDVIRERFGLEIPVYVTGTGYLREILENAPDWWGTDDKKWYHNLIFILTDEAPEEIRGLLGEPSDEWEQAQLFDDVIFWSFDLRYYQKCRWWKKTASEGIAEKLTIRTCGTVRRVCR